KEWTPDMGPKLEAAQKKLAQALGTSQVHAWGRARPHGLLEPVPDDPFRIPGIAVVVRPLGDMTAWPPHKFYCGPRGEDIEFEADEVKRAFPTLPAPSAQDWMLKEAQRLRAAGLVGKRDDMVSRCRNETGCTKRQAEAAHKELSEELRRPRGKPPKKS